QPDGASGAWAAGAAWARPTLTSSAAAPRPSSIAPASHALRRTKSKRSIVISPLPRLSQQQRQVDQRITCELVVTNIHPGPIRAWVAIVVYRDELVQAPVAGRAGIRQVKIAVRRVHQQRVGHQAVAQAGDGAA